ncbi:MAG: hypothetical protein LBD41_02705, partial [Clostridiales Family XIII bacterium]|nr:hypothetical protein [Clostridiales Family XIII bacterium]
MNDFDNKINIVELKISAQEVGNEIGILGDERLRLYIKDGFVELDDVTKLNIQGDFLATSGNTRLILEGLRSKLKADALSNIELYNVLSLTASSPFITETREDLISDLVNFLISPNPIYKTKKFSRTNGHIDERQNNTVIQSYYVLASAIRSGNTKDLLFDDYDDYQYISEYLANKIARKFYNPDNDNNWNKEKEENLLRSVKRDLDFVKVEGIGSLPGFLARKVEAARKEKKNEYIGLYDLLYGNDDDLRAPDDVIQELKKGEVDIRNIDNLPRDEIWDELEKIRRNGINVISEYDYIELLLDKSKASGWVLQRLNYLWLKKKEYHRSFDFIKKSMEENISRIKQIIKSSNAVLELGIDSFFNDRLLKASDEQLDEQLNGLVYSIMHKEMEFLGAKSMKLDIAASVYGVMRPLRINMSNVVLNNDDKLVIAKKIMLQEFDRPTRYLLKTEIETLSGYKYLYELIFELSSRNEKTETLLADENFEIYSNLISRAAEIKKRLYEEKVEQLYSINLDDVANARTNFQKVFYLTDDLYGNFLTMQQRIDIENMSEHGILYSILPLLLWGIGAAVLMFIPLGVMLVPSALMIATGIGIEATLVWDNVASYVKGRKMFRFVEDYRQGFDLIGENKAAHFASWTSSAFAVWNVTLSVAFTASMISSLLRGVKVAAFTNAVYQERVAFYRSEGISLTLKEKFAGRFGIHQQVQNIVDAPRNAKILEKASGLKVAPVDAVKITPKELAVQAEAFFYSPINIAEKSPKLVSTANPAKGNPIFEKTKNILEGKFLDNKLKLTINRYDRFAIDHAFIKATVSGPRPVLPSNPGASLVFNSNTKVKITEKITKATERYGKQVSEIKVRSQVLDGVAGKLVEDWGAFTSGGVFGKIMSAPKVGYDGLKYTSALVRKHTTVVKHLWTKGQLSKMSAYDNGMKLLESIEPIRSDRYLYLFYRANA